MITNIKSFGSYVWKSPTSLFLDDNYKSNFQEILYSLGIKDQCSIPHVWTPLLLVSKQKYNDDTSIFRFQLPKGKRYLHLPLGSFLLLLAPNCEYDKEKNLCSDAVRPYTSIYDDHLNNRFKQDESGYFEILCKRYDQWGVKESSAVNFLFTKTDHSYKPAGIVSNYLHSREVGDFVQFKFNGLCIDGTIKLHQLLRQPLIVLAQPYSHTKTNYHSPNEKKRNNNDDINLINNPSFINCSNDKDIIRSNSNGLSERNKSNLTSSINSLTLIVVGVGVAPMINLLRYLLLQTNDDQNSYGIDKNMNKFSDGMQIVLLYGVREVKDILMKEFFDELLLLILQSNQTQFNQLKYPNGFGFQNSSKNSLKIIYCVGSRWNNVHIGMKTKDQYEPPPLPTDFDSLLSSTHTQSQQSSQLPSPSFCTAELGWITEDKIRRYAHPPAHDTKVIVCGLPAVYENICGQRFDLEITKGSALSNLGYTQDMVVKL